MTRHTPLPASAKPFEPPAGFVDMSEAEGIVLDLRYATTNNFLGRNIYGGFDRLLLHAIAAAKLEAAAADLMDRRPDLRLLVFDGLRPNRVQRIFWEIVRGTDQQRYVGDPAIGSVHGFGFAVDLSLVGQDGDELDMGTPFDDFTPLAEPCREAEFLASGALTREQVDNRRLLRGVMERAGFIALPIEWWHFDALPAAEVRARYGLVE
jgi:D-alanyl-D-alanine dipeptidase